MGLSQKLFRKRLSQPFCFCGGEITPNFRAYLVLGGDIRAIFAYFLLVGGETLLLISSFFSFPPHLG
jgi:hypothetical protein